MYVYSIGDNRFLMKYAAKINSGNIVIDVVTIGDDVSNVESYCADTFGGIWVEAYNNGTRKQMPSNGFTWDNSNQVFLTPQPYSDFVLDSNFDWEAPNGMPKPTTDAECSYPNPIDPANPNVYTDVTWNSTDEKWQATQDLTTGDTVQWNGSEWIVV